MRPAKRRSASTETPAVSGRPGPGEITMRAGASRSISSTRHRVVAHDLHLGAELAEPVRQIPGERIVVVDEQQHAQMPRFAISSAWISARALSRVSSYSAAGCESATMPAPAWISAWPSRMVMVRIAMQKSRLPAKSR